MTEKLNENFINELFKLMFSDKVALDICKEHLRYEYIPKELPEYKQILKSVISTYINTNSPTTIGIVSEQHKADPRVQEALSNIKRSEIPPIEQVVDQLETFVYNAKFQLLAEEVEILYKQGKIKEGIQLMSAKSREIVETPIKKSLDKFLRVFGDFEEQQRLRREEQQKDKPTKVPFGIDPIDEITYGGIDEGEMALWIMPSGVGKSTALKWTGVWAATQGHDVLHIQLEGGRDAAFDKYSQAWTALDFLSIKKGNVPKDHIDKIKKSLDALKMSGNDIYLYSFEKFGDVTMNDVRNLIIEYEKEVGKYPDLIIIDSLDLLTPGDGHKYGIDTQSVKQRMQRTAQLMSNICVQFKTRILTATQTGDLPLANDLDFFITRTNTEGDRTLVKPFSYVMSFNQTFTERKLKRGRIYIDKLRYSDPKDMIFDIATDYGKGRFYDRSRTFKLEKLSVEKKKRNGKKKVSEI